MEFLISKTKRCGGFILRPHRREAARIVFFAFLSLFLPIGLVAILSHASNYLYFSLLGAARSFSPASFSLTAAALLVILFHLPLFFGIKRWYLILCRPEQMRKPSILYFFSSFRLYIKAVFTGLLLTVQRCIFYLCGTAPALISLLVAVVFFRSVPNDLGGSLSLLCLTAAAGLFFCGIQAARLAGKRFYWIPWLLANDPSLPLCRIFSESVRLTRKNGETLNRVRRSVRGGKLLSFCLFPALWAFPLSECTLAVWLSGKLPAAEASSSRHPFRQRKTKRTALSA